MLKPLVHKTKLPFHTTNITYDQNGNLKTLWRNAYLSTSPSTNVQMDQLTYNYQSSCSNKLDYIDDGIVNSDWEIDLIGQGIHNYEYDALGRIIEDSTGKLRTYYNFMGLVDSVTQYHYPGTWDKMLAFSYDEHGMRLSKTVCDTFGVAQYTDWYINTSGGVNVATYRQDDLYEAFLTDHSIYGMGNIGIRESDLTYYSIGDHLGSVRAVVSAGASGTEVTKYADYYPWGWEMPNRNGYVDDFRHGYQGQFTEADPLTHWTSFELRMYEGRMARWMSTDPYYQYHSPYLAMGNNPVSGVDPDGGYLNCLVSVAVGYAALGVMIGYTNLRGSADMAGRLDQSTRDIPGGPGGGEELGDGGLEGLHLALDAAGLIPGIGELFDGANALLYLSEGNYTDAALSAAAMVPIAGAGATAVKIAKNAAKVSSKVGKSINQLNKLVKTGKAPKSIKRFDKGKDINQPIDHVHFKDGNALRKDGKWRHGKGRRLTNEESKFLEENGWKIPNSK